MKKTCSNCYCFSKYVENRCLLKNCETEPDSSCQYWGKDYNEVALKVRESMHRICKEIGCSGTDPDLCMNHPEDCTIIKLFM